MAIIDNGPLQNGASALLRACWNGELEIVKILHKYDPSSIVVKDDVSLSILLTICDHVYLSFTAGPLTMQLKEVVFMY